MTFEAAFIEELRGFMTWTRSTLESVQTSMHSLERHVDQQNGNIALVMERERDTRKCAEDAQNLAIANRQAIKVHGVTAEILQRVDDEQQCQTREEVKWLRDNIWKLALGGVSLLTLGKLALDIVERLTS